MFDTHIDPGANHGVGVAFTNRFGGCSVGELASLNLGRTDIDELDRLRANLAGVLTALGVESAIFVHQVHGRQVLEVDAGLVATWTLDSWLGTRGATGVPLRIADAMITSQRGVGLAIRVADCLPVLFADTEAGLIGAAHAGRVGLLDGVLGATVEALQARGARHLQAWLGPHICGQCYELPAAMVEQAASRWPVGAVRTRWGTLGLDLGAIAAAQLSELGVPLTRCDPCTHTESSLFSYRGDGAATGRQVGLIWLG